MTMFRTFYSFEKTDRAWGKFFSFIFSSNYRRTLLRSTGNCRERLRVNVSFKNSNSKNKKAFLKLHLTRCYMKCASTNVPMKHRTKGFKMSYFLCGGKPFHFWNKNNCANYQAVTLNG
jgi:hypothetical protein